MDVENEGCPFGASELLRGLSAESSERLRSLATPVHLRDGQWLFREGEDADSAFVVGLGRLEVVAEGGEGAPIRTIKRGEVIGELALLTRTTRSASARALRDCELLEIGRAAFEQILADDHQFALTLCSQLARQVAANRSPTSVRAPPHTVAIVGLDAGLQVDEVADRLAATLAAAGEVAVLRSQGGTLGEGAGVAIIDRAQATSRWVILTANEGPADRWTNVCLAEADRVVALTRGSPTSGWLASPGSLGGCELLVLGSEAPGWLLAATAPRAVQVLADQNAVERCLALGARRLNGTAVGIVFSGGGARAFAHLGVVEELRAAGVRIDRVGGASMGALVAGAVATELTDAEIYDAFRRYFVDRNPSGDYTVPVYSLIRGRRTRRLLEDAFGKIRIEQLPLRFFCVSSDLNSRSLVVHRTGRLDEAIFASLAIPGVFPPIPAPDGRLLVDGGVLDNLPVETMASDGEGPVIAVDVTRAAPWRAAPADSPAAWRDSGRMLLSGQRAELPHLAETMFRTLAVGSRDTVAAARRHADVVITPEVENAGMLDWKQLPRMRAAGRIAVRRMLEAAPDALGICL